MQEPESRAERRIRIVEPGRPLVQMTHRVPHILNDDFYALLLLDGILHGAKGLNLWSTPWQESALRSSRLYKALIEKKLATKIQSELIPTQESYLYRISLTLPDSLQFQAAEEAVIEELDRMRLMRSPILSLIR